jgi:hypothetical protein
LIFAVSVFAIGSVAGAAAASMDISPPPVPPPHPDAMTTFQPLRAQSKLPLSNGASHPKDTRLEGYDSYCGGPISRATCLRQFESFYRRIEERSRGPFPGIIGASLWGCPVWCMDTHGLKEEWSALARKRDRIYPARRMPDSVGKCLSSSVDFVAPREAVSGAVVTFANGGFQSLLEGQPPLAAVLASRKGDPVTICLLQKPDSKLLNGTVVPCPAWDRRGSIYSVHNLRTGGSWELPDAPYPCAQETAARRTKSRP